MPDSTPVDLTGLIVKAYNWAGDVEPVLDPTNSNYVI